MELWFRKRGSPPPPLRRHPGVPVRGGFPQSWSRCPSPVFGPGGVRNRAEFQRVVPQTPPLLILYVLTIFRQT